MGAAPPGTGEYAVASRFRLASRYPDLGRERRRRVVWRPADGYGRQFAGQSSWAYHRMTIRMTAMTPTVITAVASSAVICLRLRWSESRCRHPPGFRGPSGIPWFLLVSIIDPPQGSTRPASRLPLPGIVLASPAVVVAPGAPRSDAHRHFSIFWPLRGNSTTASSISGLSSCLGSLGSGMLRRYGDACPGPPFVGATSLRSIPIPADPGGRSQRIGSGHRLRVERAGGFYGRVETQSRKR